MDYQIYCKFRKVFAVEFIDFLICLQTRGTCGRIKRLTWAWRKKKCLSKICARQEFSLTKAALYLGVHLPWQLLIANGWDCWDLDEAMTAHLDWRGVSYLPTGFRSNEWGSCVYLLSEPHTSLVSGCASSPVDLTVTINYYSLCNTSGKWKLLMTLSSSIFSWLTRIGLKPRLLELSDHAALLSLFFPNLFLWSLRIWSKWQHFLPEKNAYTILSEHQLHTCLYIALWWITGPMKFIYRITF